MVDDVSNKMPDCEEVGQWVGEIDMARVEELKSRRAKLRKFFLEASTIHHLTSDPKRNSLSQLADHPPEAQASISKGFQREGETSEEEEEEGESGRGPKSGKRRHGNKALVGAAYKGTEEDVMALLAAGYEDVDEEDTWSGTALIGAAKRGFEGAVKALLAAAASINVRDKVSRGD